MLHPLERIVGSEMVRKQAHSDWHSKEVDTDVGRTSKRLSSLVDLIRCMMYIFMPAVRLFTS